MGVEGIEPVSVDELIIMAKNIKLEIKSRLQSEEQIGSDPISNIYVFSKVKEAIAKLNNDDLKLLTMLMSCVD